MRVRLLFAVILQCWTVTGSDAAIRILLAILNHNSHVMYFGQLAKALAASGNDVTALIGSGMKIMPEFQTDITWITYKMSGPPVTYSDEQVGAILQAYLGNTSMYDGIKTMKGFFEKMGDEAMELYDDEELMIKLSESNFDFVVVDASILAFLHIPYRLGVPFATLSIDIDPVISRLPWYNSYVPPLMSSFSDHMTFTQRTISFVSFYTITPILRLLVPDNGIENSDRCAPNKPPQPYLHLLSESSMFFTLRLPTLHFIRGSMPNIFDIGGIMGRPADLSNISPEMNSFINKSPHGVIMVSFGSWLDKLPTHIMNKLLEAFSASDYDFIWKVSAVPDKKPSNVMFTGWMPQNDLLGHPKTKAFVTHCGISGVIETTYHGVPIVGFPLGLDQAPNARLMEHREFGVIMDITTFSPADLIQAINNVSQEGNVYRRSIQRASAILKDMPNAGKTASFWINHVVQHGGDHLRSAAHDFTWYQYLSVDVFMFLFIMCAVVVKLMHLCCMKCCGMMCRKCKRSMKIKAE